MNFCKLGLKVIEMEAKAVLELTQRIDQSFNIACESLLRCKGRIIVTGIGKSGHIGKKISSTFASTGSPSFFIHPAEARHGDAGMITKEDIIIAISHSGQTEEIISLLPTIKRLQIPLIALTGNSCSILAQTATVCLDVSISKEACPLGLAPTTSTTVALVMGDALAVALLEARGFTANDFAQSHPGGALGKKLLLKVKDLHHTGDAIPKVPIDTTIRDTLIEVNEKKLGMTCVLDLNQSLLGVLTDGDIRRVLSRRMDIDTTPLSDVISTQFKSISENALAAEALALMQQHQITSLIVVDEFKQLSGIIHIHDLLRAGVI